ncbi:sensor histidine kinase [Paenibacillus sp. p3-SID1389]|uniref:sensor histidine kinase n=1 Tax=Paenibacillus sp. p3-SID1389 TaxID=2916364 RepID=UPI0021A37FA1|nr:sensor histidine kinase [Paenibacillus sp. p3-SID1389]MCT2194202.1 sensor histidine kinase [Paenibacillus sp. p3-SID1389]
MIKRLFMNQSIRAKIVWSTVLISLVPLLVLSYLFYQNSTRSLEQAMVRSSDQNAEYLSDYLNEYFRSFSTSALQVYGFKRVIDLMEYGTNYNVADIIDVRESLASYYRLAVSNNADIIKIMVYGSDNTLRDSWSRADSYNAIALNQTTPHYGDIVKLPFQHSLMFTYQDPAIKQDLFVYALPIYDPFYREKFGTLLFYVLGKDLAKKVETYNRAPNVIVLQNGKGEAFYRTNPNYDAEIQPYRLPDELSDSNEQVLQFTEGRELLISTSPLDHGNIGLSIVYPSTELAHNRKTTLSITIAALALVMLVIAAFSLLAQQFITRPIQYLGKAMKAVRKGNFDVVLPTNRWHDDLSELTASFNFMTRTIQELIEKEYKLQLRNKEAQFLALQMQINPHFLYNTLQTIGGKAVLAGDYEIHEMCRALGDIFRYSFYEGNMESTIGAELAHLNNYLYIQQFRFEESLKTRFDVQSELMDAPIIRFVLQPILENIMVHALGKDRRSAVQIEVSAQREDGHIRISISDDGPGMEPDKLKALRAVLARPASKVFSGVSIGLRNVHERIRLFYGPPYGLEIDSSLGKGTTVSLTIPYPADVEQPLRTGGDK